MSSKRVIFKNERFALQSSSNETGIKSCFYHFKTIKADRLMLFRMQIGFCMGSHL